MLGAVLFVSRLLMAVFPNIHLVGVLIAAMTLVYRKKALFPLYVYVLLEGVFSGFSAWWIPYLYVWTVLWAACMLLPREMSGKKRPLLWMGVCACHGFLFGVLYAPVQALLFGLDFRGMCLWIAAGLPFDLIHGVSNFFCGILIFPLASILRKAEVYAQS